MDNSYTYWVRTAVGLEEIFLQEISSKYDLGQSEIKHKSVFFSLNSKPKDLISFASKLQTADDIYLFYGSCKGIDNTKSSTDPITHFFKDAILEPLKHRTTGSCRITVSFLGTRNFNRFYVENNLNQIIEHDTNHTILSNEKEEKWKEGEIRIRIHIENDIAYFGIGILDRPVHRRKWRLNSYPAQLHPPLAAAMVRMVQPDKDIKIIDPFSGSGTILIESAMQYPTLRHIGFDINADAVRIATENANLAQSAIEVYHDDFIKQYQSIGDYILITNPPWGEKHLLNSGDQKTFYQNLIKIISQSKAAILLIPEDLIINLKSRGIAYTELFKTRIHGKLASVIKITTG